jgi:hypothetical protein
MSDGNRDDMPDLSVRDLRTEMDRQFADVDRRFAEVDRRFTEVDRRFDRLEARMHEEHVETRRHFDVVAESPKTQINLRFEGTDTVLDNHERRIQALEKRRR